MRRLLALLIVPVFGLALVACGDDDDGGDVEAFCDRMIELDEDDSELELADPEAEAILQEVVLLAPTGEVRAALETLVEFIQRLDELEEDGDEEDAFGAAFELLFDPEFLQAADTLETYLEEECGIEPDDDAIDLDEDFGDLEDFDFEDGPDAEDTDPLSGTAVRDAVEAAVDGVVIDSSGTFTVGDETIISLRMDLDSADPMDVCEAAVDYVEGVDGGDDVEIEITDAADDDTVVERLPGGDCNEV